MMKISTHKDDTKLESRRRGRCDHIPGAGMLYLYYCRRVPCPLSVTSAAPGLEMVTATIMVMTGPRAAAGSGHFP